MTGLLNRIDRVLRDQAGVALLAAVLAMGVLGFLGATFAGLVVEHQYAAVNQARALEALYLAEAGLELAALELIENADKAFNGAAADGVIGGITNVPVGSGSVSVTKGTQTPPVFTATGTVGTVRRVLTMTIDLPNLVTLDPVFSDAVTLLTNWPETPGANSQGTSGIASVANSCCSPSALKAQTNTGSNNRFDAYREQALNPTIPPDRRILARLSYMRDRTGGSASVKHGLSLLLVKSDATTGTVWSIGPSPAVSDADQGVWFTAEIGGWATSTSLTTQKVRPSYDVRTAATAQGTDQSFGWLDNIEVRMVKKSAWGEP